MIDTSAGTEVETYVRVISSLLESTRMVGKQVDIMGVVLFGATV